MLTMRPIGIEDAAAVGVFKLCPSWMRMKLISP